MAGIVGTIRLWIDHVTGSTVDAGKLQEELERLDREVQELKALTGNIQRDN